MRLFRPGIIVGWLFPDAIFRIRTKEKILCLTFDDGPYPDSTPHLLEILKKYNINALFFCEGRAAEEYPLLVNNIKEGGHQIGNHGYNHLNGWTTTYSNYIDDVEKAAPHTSFSMFRPPYGRLRFSQYNTLKKSYKIVFWDLMPYDFDSSFGSKKSLEILKKKIRPGSIIVFHNNSGSTLADFIEEFVLFTRAEGYRFIDPFI